MTTEEALNRLGEALDPAVERAIEGDALDRFFDRQGTFGKVAVIVLLLAFWACVLLAAGAMAMAAGVIMQLPCIAVGVASAAAGIVAGIWLERRSR